MIKYNNSNINDWYFDTSDIIKVYRNNAICYYKITVGGGQTPCFAVVDDISQYSDTEFEDVFNKADNKWYKLNNLNEYEEYGIYGSGRTITTYDGKLTIDDEITPSPSRLPDGYTEVEYITSENTSTNVSGPYIDTLYKPNQTTRVILDYQPKVNGQKNRRVFGSGEYDTIGYVYNMEESVGQSNCYYYYKYGDSASWYTTSIHPDLNRHTVDFNNNGQILLDGTSIATLPSTTFTCDFNLGLFRSIYNDYTSFAINFLGRVYSCKVYDNGTLVRDLVPCKNASNVVGMYDVVNGVFYTTANASYQFGAGSAVTPTPTTATCEYIYSGNSWVNVGEISGGTYPVYYEAKSDPPNNLTFSSMTEAESYECPWVGMEATIDGDNYIFSGDSQSGYEWVTEQW